MCNRYVSPDQAAIERAWHLSHQQPLRWPGLQVPRAQGPFLRASETGQPAIIVGQWGLIPQWSKTRKLQYATNNCRSEEAAGKPTFRDAWRQAQRCIIPALSFDEPNWESGKNVWWRFRRKDEKPWGLAGLWNRWTDRETGEIVESYTMLTVNADSHPLMSRMHKPDPKLLPDQQDKRSVVAIEMGDVERWLKGGWDEFEGLVRAPEMGVIEAGAM